MAAPNQPNLSLAYSSQLQDTGQVFQFTGDASISEEGISNFPTNGFCISFWIKCGGSQNDAVIWSYDAGETSTSNQIYLKNPSNLVLGIGESAVSAATGVSIDDNNWHHLALNIVPNAGNKSWQVGICKDGVQVYKKGWAWAIVILSHF